MRDEVEHSDDARKDAVDDASHGQDLSCKTTSTGLILIGFCCGNNCHAFAAFRNRN